MLPAAPPSLAHHPQALAVFPSPTSHLRPSPARGSQRRAGNAKKDQIQPSSRSPCPCRRTTSPWSFCQQWLLGRPASVIPLQQKWKQCCNFHRSCTAPWQYVQSKVGQEIPCLQPAAQFVSYHWHPYWWLVWVKNSQKPKQSIIRIRSRKIKYIWSHLGNTTLQLWKSHSCNRSKGLPSPAGLGPWPAWGEVLEKEECKFKGLFVSLRRKYRAMYWDCIKKRWFPTDGGERKGKLTVSPAHR